MKCWHLQQVWQAAKYCFQSVSPGPACQCWWWCWPVGGLVSTGMGAVEEEAGVSILTPPHHVRTSPTPSLLTHQAQPTTPTTQRQMANNINSTNNCRPLWIHPQRLREYRMRYNNNSDLITTNLHMCWCWSSYKWKQITEIAPLIIFLIWACVQFSSGYTLLPDDGWWSEDWREMNDRLITKLIIILSKNCFPLLACC